MGLPVRGAITRGALHHRPDELVGPALIRAYFLERAVAFYPRIIFDPDVALGKTEWADAIATDNDDILYLDYLNWSVRLHASSHALEAPQVAIALAFLKHHSSLDTTLLPQYNWLRRYHSQRQMLSHVEGEGSHYREREASQTTAHLQEQERLAVVFLDILGFRTLVHKTSNGDFPLSRLLLPLRLLKAAQGSKHRMTVFSDSIVLTATAEQDAIDRLFVLTATLSCAMVLLEFPIRGAATIGYMFHSDRAVYGPALTRAFKLESKTAIYPRVVVDPAIEWTKVTSIPEIIKTDFDGTPFLHFLHPDIVDQCTVIPTANGTSSIHQRLEEALHQIRKQAEHDPSVQMKVEWLDLFYSRTWTRD
jgi:hypothetical protein